MATANVITGESPSVQVSKRVAYAAPNRPYFPVLDGVRAVAALMVIVFHFVQSHGHQTWFFIGQTGVDLFFVLSGFLITLILLESRDEPHAFRRFYIRRALRIFPLYYGFLIAMTFIHRAPAWEFWVYLQNYASTFGRNIGFPEHFWSLAVEEHFYLVWPFIALKVNRRRLPWIAAGMVAFSIIARTVRGSVGVDTFAPTDCRLDGLALGALLGLAYEAGKLRSVLKYFYVAVPVILVLIGTLFLKFGGQHSVLFQVAKPILFGSLYAALVGVVLGLKQGIVSAGLSSSALRLVGRISYGLYVVHPVLIIIVARFMAGKLLLQFLVVMALSFAVAWMSYTFYERPFLKLKVRFE